MRSFLLIASALLAFGATMTFEPHRGQRRGLRRRRRSRRLRRTRGAVVVRKPVVVCRTVMVNGVKVRRCT